MREQSHLDELFKEPTRTETYAKALMIAMKTKNITSLKIAWATIGQSLTQAQEVISLANVQLQGAVLSEWFRSLDASTRRGHALPREVRPDAGRFAAVCHHGRAPLVSCVVVKLFGQHVAVYGVLLCGGSSATSCFAF